MGVSIAFSDIRNQFDGGNHKKKITIWNYIIERSRDWNSFNINSREIPSSAFYNSNFIFYPHEVVVTDKNQTIQFINPHIQNPSEWKNYEERKADIIASNETTVAYAENGKLYKKLLKGDDTLPKEIMLTEWMKLVQPLIVTKSGNILYGLEKSGKTELHMNGERIGDIPEFIGLKYIQTTWDTCVIIAVLPNGVNQNYSIDTTLSASRPEGTEARVTLARAATARVLDTNKNLTKKIQEATLGNWNLEHQINDLTETNTNLRKEIFVLQEQFSQSEKEVKDVKMAAKMSKDINEVNRDEDHIKITWYETKLKKIETLLHQSPVPTGTFSKSVSEKDFLAYIAQLQELIK